MLAAGAGCCMPIRLTGNKTDDCEEEEKECSIILLLLLAHMGKCLPADNDARCLDIWLASPKNITQSCDENSKYVHGKSLPMTKSVGRRKWKGLRLGKKETIYQSSSTICEHPLRSDQACRSREPSYEKPGELSVSSFFLQMSDVFCHQLFFGLR